MASGAFSGYRWRRPDAGLHLAETGIGPEIVEVGIDGEEDYRMRALGECLRARERGERGAAVG